MNVRRIAIEAVEHDPHCSVDRIGADGTSDPMPCSCSRESRIAKAFQVAARTAYELGKTNGAADSFGLMADSDKDFNAGMAEIIASFKAAL